MIKRKKIFTYLFLLTNLIALTSCDTEDLGKDISVTVQKNLIPNLWSTLAQILATIILFTVIIVFAIKPVRKYLDSRKELLDNEVKITEENKKIAEENAKKSDQIILESHQKAKTIIDNAVTQASVYKDEIINQAKDEANRKIKDSQLIIDKQKKQAYDEIHNAIVNVAIDTSEKILSREITDKDNKKIVDDFINDLNKEGKNQ